MKRISESVVAPIILFLLTGCSGAPGAYGVMSNSPVLVKPTIGWYQKGVAPQATESAIDACRESAHEEPEYLRLIAEARAVQMGSQGYTEQQREIVGAPGRYAGGRIEKCMNEQGFSIQRLPRSRR